MSVDFRSLLQMSLKRGWKSTHSLACGEFTIEQVLWDPFIRHAVNMSKPAESALLEKDVEALDSSLGPLFQSGVKSPRLAAIEEGAEDRGSVYGHLGLDGQLAVLQESFDQSGKGRGCSSDAPVGLSIREKSSGTVKPRYVHSFTTSSLLLCIDCDFRRILDTLVHNVSLFYAGGHASPGWHVRSCP